jgi:putative DNA primase/helicase
MTIKIEAELPVIICHLDTCFADQQGAHQLLSEQQTDEEDLAIRRECDSLVDYCGYLMASQQCEGMLIGNAEVIWPARR